MSNGASIGNFYVDADGREQPIRYQAVDLVNKPAPPGYHWELITAYDDWVRIASRADPFGSFFDSDTEEANEDYYICVRDRVTGVEAA